MRLVRVDERVPNKSHLHLHHITDTHCGHANFDEDALRERVELIRVDPNARWTFGGDHGELVRFNDRRYEPSLLAPRYRQATDLKLATREHFVELFEPIKDKCWGLCDGNHETAVDKYMGGHALLEACCDLGLEGKWVDYRGLIHARVFLTKTMQVGVIVDLSHGWQGGRLKGAPQVQMERELGFTDADVILRGHNHQPSAHTWQTLGINHAIDRIVPRFRTAINGGSWVRSYLDNPKPVDRERLSEVERAGWAERKGFRPEPVGGPVLRITFDYGYPRNQNGTGRALTVTHTTFEGHIDAGVLGI